MQDSVIAADTEQLAADVPRWALRRPRAAEAAGAGMLAFGTDVRAYAQQVIDDRDRDLGTVLSYLVGRPVPTVELAKALGVARSSYYAARDQGRLITADNLLRLADIFGLNPVDLLVRYGLVSHDAAVEYARDTDTAPATTGTANTAGLHPRMDLPPL